MAVDKNNLILTSAALSAAIVVGLVEVLKRNPFKEKTPESGAPADEILETTVKNAIKKQINELVKTRSFMWRSAAVVSVITLASILIAFRLN